MKKKMKNQNKLLLEILPDTISDREVPAFFSKEKLKLLKQNGIRASFIISSEPVDAKAYFFLMNILKKFGMQVYSFYFDAPDEQQIESLRTAVYDLQKALSSSGCIIISYRSRFALALIAGLYLVVGRSVDTAIAAVQGMKKDSADLHWLRPLLDRLHTRLTGPADDTRQIHDAIKIDRSQHMPKPQPLPGKAHPGTETGNMLPAGASPKNDGAPSSNIPLARRKEPGKKETVVKPRGETESKSGKASTYSAPVSTSAGTGSFYQSIRFKLISIISIIIIASLTGMIFLASYFLSFLIIIF